MNLEPVPRKIFLYDFQTEKWSEWFSDPAGIGYPAWSSDSRYIDYWSATDIKRLRLGASSSEKMFSLKPLKIYMIPEFGPWNDSAADGSRMFLRDASTDDIYALDLDFQ